MSTYIIKHSIYSGSVILNTNNVVLSNDPAISLAQSGSPLTTPGKIGDSLSLSYPYIAVGDPTNQAVYIYKFDGTSWTLNTTINSPEQSGSGYATSMSMKDHILAVGSPKYNSNQGAVYIYLLVDGVWETTPRHVLVDDNESGIQLGEVVHTSEHYVLASAPKANVSDSTAGMVYAFQYNYVRDIFNLETTFTSSIGGSSNGFGSSIDMMGDDTIIISSPNAPVTNGSALTNAGSIEIFNKPSGTWKYNMTLESPLPITGGLFGTSIDAQPGRIIVGEPGANYVHVFDYHMPNWSLYASMSYGTSKDLVDATVKSGDLQGSSVSQNVSQKSYIWSSPDNNSTGVVYVAETTQAGNIVSSITPRLEASDSANGSGFGSKIVYDGTFLIVLSPNSNSGNGEIVIFKK